MKTRFSHVLLLTTGVFCLSPSVTEAQTHSLQGPLLPQIAAAQPQIRVTLSRPVYLIQHNPKTGAPVMPSDVAANAQFVNFPPGTPLPSQFTWHVTLEWNIQCFGTKHPIGNKLVVHSSPYTIDLREQVKGGTLTVIAKGTVGGREYIGVSQASVVADNPPKSVILAHFPKSRWGLIASKIGMVESGLHQFSVAKGQPGGMPEVSYSRDIGLMQLNAPSGAVTREEQVWDWRENMAQGLRMLEGKHRTSQLAYRAGNVRGGFRVVTPIGGSALAAVNVARALIGLPDATVPAVSGAENLSGVPGSGICPGEPDPDKLALTQIERDAIRRYNGGREYSLMPQIDPQTLTVKSVSWQVDPTRGGINPTSGNPHYVLDVLKARSGFSLPEPAKPSTKKTKKSRRKRSRR